MPDPSHQVSRSVALLRRLGYTRTEALRTVVTVCYAARHVLDPDGELAPTWIDGVQARAEFLLGEGPVPYSGSEATSSDTSTGPAGPACPGPAAGQ